MTDRINKAPDSDVLAAKKTLEARIHTILIKLPGLIRHRLQSDSFWRISECMNVNESTYDFGRLPVYYKRPTSPRPKKYDCLRALATFVLVKWWDYVLEKNITPYPTVFLDQLELIIEKGLGAFKCEGNHERGFKLVPKICFQCNGTGIDRGEKDADGRLMECSCDCPLGIERDVKYADEINLDNKI